MGMLQYEELNHNPVKTYGLTSKEIATIKRLLKRANIEQNIAIINYIMRL